MKPDAPEGIRGEFKPIATNVPGISVCEHLPGLAAQADRLAIVRSMSHEQTNHLNATHQILTGQAQPGAFFDKIASRDDYPCYASALDYVRPRADGVPSGVMLPTFLMEGPLVWPGQHAGFLGPKHDPWQIKQDPSQPDFRGRDLAPARPASASSGSSRRRTCSTQLAPSATPRPRLAIDPLRAARAGVLAARSRARSPAPSTSKREDPKVRDRYGRHMFGQSLLLARRLVQAGVPIVQVNMGRVQNWDTHSGNFKSAQGPCCLPPTDQGVSALLDDLAATGLLDETLVVVDRRVRPHAADRREHRQRQQPRTAATTGRAASRPSSPARGSGAARRSASPTGSAPTPPAAPTPRPTSPRPSTSRSASTPRPSSATASAAPSASAPARRSSRSSTARRPERRSLAPALDHVGAGATVFSYLPSEAFWILGEAEPGEVAVVKAGLRRPGLERQARRLEDPRTGRPVEGWVVRGSSAIRWTTSKVSPPSPFSRIS